MEAIKEIAAQKGCAAAQVALAWVLGRGNHVVAIPGTTKLANLQTNLRALDCRLTDEDRVVLDTLADTGSGGPVLAWGDGGDQPVTVAGPDFRPRGQPLSARQGAQPDASPLRGWHHGF